MAGAGAGAHKVDDVPPEFGAEEQQEPGFAWDTVKKPFFTDANGWGQPHCFTTLQLVVADGKAWVLTTDGSRIYLTQYQPGGRWSMSRMHRLDAAVVAANNLTAASSFRTFQAVADGHTICVMYRGATQLLVFTFDTRKLRWTCMPPWSIMADALGWQQEPLFASIRMQVMHGTIYIVSRCTDGLHMWSCEVHNGKWQAYAAMPMLSDADGGHIAGRYDTVRMVPIADKLYVVARDGKCICIAQFDPNCGVSKSPWTACEPTFFMQDTEGWNASKYYLTFHALEMGGQLYVMGRGPTGIIMANYDPALDQWDVLSPIEFMQDEAIWGQPAGYTTIRFVALGSVIYILGRQGTTLHAARYDPAHEAVSVVPQLERYMAGEPQQPHGQAAQAAHVVAGHGWNRGRWQGQGQPQLLQVQAVQLAAQAEEARRNCPQHGDYYDNYGEDAAAAAPCTCHSDSTSAVARAAVLGNKLLYFCRGTKNCHLALCTVTGPDARAARAAPARGDLLQRLPEMLAAGGATAATLADAAKALSRELERVQSAATALAALAAALQPALVAAAEAAQHPAGVGDDDEIDEADDEEEFQ